MKKYSITLDSTSPDVLAAASDAGITDGVFQIELNNLFDLVEIIREVRKNYGEWLSEAVILLVSHNFLYSLDIEITEN
jgi:hypothetical protein